MAGSGLKAQRRWYAEELRWSGGLTSERLVRALATVPREAFLGRGPWQIVSGTKRGRGYVKTPDADPRHLSHNVLVAIDPKRRLNKGQPSFLAWLIDRLDLEAGDTAYHIGCGTGYYSAVMAEMVGRRGRVVAVELEEGLAVRARKNLKAYRQVEVVSGNGVSHNPGRVDALLVNAGIASLPGAWLQILRSGGRLVAPFTASDGGGRILEARKSGRRWQARFVGKVGIFHCTGARSAADENRLKRALAGGDADKVRSLRLDSHARRGDCWLHHQHYCLSRRSP